MFVFPSILSVGLPLVALPLLIHLINLVRQRRVRWAAMEFLLQSQKRHKNWILLKQLLLLLLRMTAIAAIAVMLAQPLLRNEWGQLFGRAKTHHVVLLDDSFSMSDRGSDGSAFQRAKELVSRLAEQAGLQGGMHTFSLIRFSRAANPTGGGGHDFTQQRIDPELLASLAQTLDTLEPSQSAAGPAGSLLAVRQLPEKTDDENRIVYLVSDFRAPQWNDPAPLRKLLKELEESGVQLHLVQCVDAARPNLAITRLQPLLGTRAAGVELFMEVAVKNFGDVAARDVAIGLEEDGHPRPGLVIDEVAAGEAVKRRFRVNFPTAGQHFVTATLRSDAVLTDNSRYAVMATPATVPVLIVDGHPDARDGYFLAAGLSPGGTVRTGLRPQIEAPSFLRKKDELAKFLAIYLLNIGHLDATEIESLEQYVAAGGGVAFFLGERDRDSFVNEHLYRDGVGLFPLPVTRPTDLLADRVETGPDIEAGDHVLFETFRAMRINPLDDVRVLRYFGVPASWQPPIDSGVHVLARLRGGAPLVVEKSFGRGRVVAVLTKTSPETTELGPWNDWAQGYSFVPVAMNLQAYLSAGQFDETERTVGVPLTVEIDPRQYQSQVQFLPPGADERDELVVDAGGSDVAREARLDNTSAAGLYTVRLRTVDGDQQQRIFAYNVIAEEGDLRLLDPQQLLARLDGVQVKVHRADELHYDPQEVAGINLSEPLLYLLLVVLAVEQLLAYSASYHPGSREVSGR